MPKYIKASNVSYPLAYGGGVFAHPKEEADLREIIERSGNKAQIGAKMEVRLKYLDVNGPKAVLHIEWFEDLKYETGLFSMIIRGTMNIRILFAFFGNRPVLLHAFTETKKSTAKTDSYRAACEVARKRMDEIEFEGESAP